MNNTVQTRKKLYPPLSLFDSNIHKKDNSNKTKFTFIDLFAGIGGIRTGFEYAGGECVFTSEWDKYAQQTYEANFW